MEPPGNSLVGLISVSPEFKTSFIHGFILIITLSSEVVVIPLTAFKWALIPFSGRPIFYPSDN